MNNRVCLKCDRPILTAWAFRIRIGGVTYDEYHGALFQQDENDYFRDHSKTKWLCRQCAEESGVYVAQLDTDTCRAPEDTEQCGCTFEPLESDQAESVLLVEWGQFCPSQKGPGEMFMSSQSGHVHFNCACDGWGLPLWSIEPSDTP